MPRKSNRLPALAGILVLAACGGDGPEDASPPPGAGAPGEETAPRAANEPQPGDTSFVSPRPGGSMGVGWSIGAPEDKWTVSGSLLVGHTGNHEVQVLGISDPRSPRLRGRVPVGGTPCSLDAVGDVVLAVVDSTRWSEGYDGVLGEHGTRIAAVDLSSPDRPVLASERHVPGSCLATALRGRILYVVTTGASGGMRVESFDVADASHPIAVDAADLALVESYRYEPRAVFSERRLTAMNARRMVAVDLSDPGGRLSVGAEITVTHEVAGWVDEACVEFDEASGAFRAVLHPGGRPGIEGHPLWSGFGVAVIDWADHRAPAVRGEIALEGPNEVTACRYDDGRLYVATRDPAVPRGDPLYVIDVGSASGPALLGQLHFEGASLTRLVTRGDRLVGLGRAYDAGVPRAVVMTFDVGDPGAPTILDATHLGPPVLSDERVILDDRVLAIAVVGSDGAGQVEGGIAFATPGRDGVEPLGFVSQPLALGPDRDRSRGAWGPVAELLRVGVDGPLVAITPQALQVLHVQPNQAIVRLAQLEFARPAAAVAVTRTGTVAVVVHRGRRHELAITDAAGLRIGDPGARVPLEGSTSTPPLLVPHGEILWALTAERRVVDGESRMMHPLVAIDVTDPTAPRPRGRLLLPGDARSCNSGTAETSEEHLGAVIAGHALVMQRCVRRSFDPSLRYGGWRYERELLVVDVSDPDVPWASAVPLGTDEGLGRLVVSGNAVWVPRYETVADVEAGVRYTATRMEVADPRAPHVEGAVNVPGELFAVSDDGMTLFMEERWAMRPFSPITRTLLHAVELLGNGTARLQRSAELVGLHGGALARGGHAYVGGTAIASVRLADMTVTALTPMRPTGAIVVGATDDMVLVTPSTASLLAFSPADPSRLRLQTDHGTAGRYRGPWRSDAAIAPDGRVYIAAGYSGVLSLPFGP